MLVAVFGVLAIVGGVTIGLVIAGGSDSSTAADTRQSDEGRGSGGDPGDEGDGGAGEPSPASEESSLVGDASFALATGTNVFEPGQQITLDPDFSMSSGVNSVELLVNNQVETTFLPGEDLTFTLADEGSYRIRLRVIPTDGPTERSPFVRLRVEDPVLGNPGVSQPLRDLAQRYSDALAYERWSEAASINPEDLAGYSEADFVYGWGNVDEQFVVPVRTLAPNVVRIGLVVWQLYPQDNPGGEPLTSLFCNTWTMDVGAQMISTTVGERVDFAPRPARTDPFTVQAELLENC